MSSAVIVSYTRDDLIRYWTIDFPFDLLSEWWKQSGDMSHRDFAVYGMYDPAKMLRYLRVPSREDWVKIVRANIPIRLDVGSVYNQPPTSQFTRDEAARKEKERMESEHEEEKQLQEANTVDDLFPVTRELVFDVDISDYFPVDGSFQRTCCVKGLCHKCWVFLACAAEIMTYLLCRMLGFVHVVVIFSGKKGIHLWVMDRGAETTTQEQRKAILLFMKLYDVDSDLECKEIMEKYVRVLAERDILRPGLDADDGKHAKRLLFPRLDQKVTHDPGHLIKCPFSLHPDTGKITLPLPPSTLASFVPEDSPTLHQVIHDASGRKKLQESIQYFRDVYEQSIAAQ